MVWDDNLRQVIQKEWTMVLMKRLAVCLLLAFSLSVSADPANPDYVTVQQIEASLAGLPPMAVGFDVDDTVIFSSPVFYQVSTTDCAAGCTAEQFWKKVNVLDSFSLPKAVGLSIVQMHIERGDTVYFIT